CLKNIKKKGYCFFKYQKDLVSGVIVDRKKKIYVKIEELLGHQLQKKQTKMEKYYEGTEWEIEDVTKQKAIQAKSWPLLNKNNLLAVALICICAKENELEIRFEDKVMITSQLEEIMTDMEVQCCLTNTHLLTMDRALVIKM
ncbi:2501_t:CDS:2, partial [Gigaspora margarita]